LGLFFPSVTWTSLPLGFYLVWVPSNAHKKVGCQALNVKSKGKALKQQLRRESCLPKAVVCGRGAAHHAVKVEIGAMLSGKK